MNLRQVFSVFIATSLTSSFVCADTLDQFRKQSLTNLKEFRDNSKKELEEFRRRVNEDIARFMSEPWTPVETTPSIELPVDPSPAPIFIDPDTVRPTEPRPIIPEELIEPPAPVPQPQPIEPIIEILPEPIAPIDLDTVPPISIYPTPVPEPAPAPTNPTEDKLEFKLYGTRFSLRQPDLSDYRLWGKSPDSYANAWRSLNNTRTNNLILDCLSLREEKALCDWAYMQMTLTLSRHLFPDNPDKATLLAGFLLCQSGYRIRFATDRQDHLQLLYSPDGLVFNVPSIVIDNYSYYIASDYQSNTTELGNFSHRYKVCNFNCPGEKQLSFDITRQIQLDYNPAPPRHVSVHNNPGIAVDVTLNSNLIDFYNSYPEVAIGTNHYSKWAMYANTPASAELQRDLYPVLREAVKDKSQQEAANILIHLAESFPYGYDSEIWGYDRAFFTEESWFYPYSDCEDHAIHFTRLVRDILGLDAVLIYYPGHLASAVAFTDNSVRGDYIMYNNKKFTVCDPTIFYANIGTTMPGCDNSGAVLINLRK